LLKSWTKLLSSQPVSSPAIPTANYLTFRKTEGSFDAFLWSFVGPTICYAFMQAVGMVNDHLVSCFRHAQLQRMAG